MENMNDFESFCNEVVKHIKEYLPEEYQDSQVSLQKICKQNDTTLTGLFIKRPESEATPNIYLEPFYEDFKKPNYSFERVIKEIANTRAKSEVGADAFSINLEQVYDFEAIKNRICCKLVNRDMNKEYLVDKPYNEFEDLAIIYQVKCGMDPASQKNVIVTNNLLNIWGVSIDEVHRFAIENIKGCGIRFGGIMETLYGFSEEDPFLFVLTNPEMINGAAVILDDSTLRYVEDRLGGSYYIIPSSVNEVIVLSADLSISVDDVETMIKTINSHECAPDEVLSDHLYLYSNGKISSVSKVA